jgi:hypothetical protein
MVTFQTDEDGMGMCLKILVGHPGHWINKTVVGEGNSIWGGILSLDNKNALVLFDHEGWCKSQKISFS